MQNTSSDKIIKFPTKEEQEAKKEKKKRAAALKRLLAYANKLKW